jgi:hypothetical protein
MPAVGRVLPWLVIAFCLLGLTLAWHEMSNPPFTTEQIKASLADTWEVHVSTSRVFLLVFSGLGAICLVLARRAHDGVTRNAAVLAAVLCLLTVGMYLRNHIALTERAAQITGQDFGPLSGLL